MCAPVSLDPATLNVLRDGCSCARQRHVGVSSSNTAVGTIVNSPRTLTAGQTCTYETGTNLFFHAVGTGSTTLTVRPAERLLDPQQSAADHGDGQLVQHGSRSAIECSICCLSRQRQPIDIDPGNALSVRSRD